MKKVEFEGRGIKVGHWSDPIYSNIDVMYDKKVGYFVRSRTPGEVEVLEDGDDFLRIGGEDPSYMKKKESEWKTRDRELCEKVYRATLKYMENCETPGVQVVVKNVKGRDGRVYDMYRTFKREEYFDGHVWEYIDIYFKLARKEEN